MKYNLKFLSKNSDLAQKNEYLAFEVLNGPKDLIANKIIAQVSHGKVVSISIEEDSLVLPEDVDQALLDLIYEKIKEG